MNMKIDKENDVVAYNDELKFKKHKNKLPNKCGIYIITSKVNNKFYIGSSNNISKRRKEHFSDLRGNRHCNQYLQNIYNKYGEENLIVEVIELCSELEQFKREQYFIDTLNPSINICKMVENNPMLGRHHTQETKDKISKANTGKKRSEETKALLTELNKNRICSEETRTKISKSRTGKITSEETKQKIREAQGTKIVQLDKNLKIVKIWDSMNECEKEGFNHSCISNVCSGKRKSHKGFIWKKLSEKEDIKNINIDFDINCPRRKYILQYDINNKLIKEYVSANEAFKESNEFFKEEGIRKSCRTGNVYKGFIFKYKDNE